LYRPAEDPLKFFTRGWIHGDMIDEEAEAVSPAYRRHLEASDLPHPVRDLASLSPHDAYILNVEHEPSAGTLRLRLRCGDLQTGYFDAFVDFTGVTIRPAHAAALVEARRPAEFEILCDEVDRAAAGAFAYRLLLDPVGEVSFQFKGVAVVRRRVADRRAV
jgi:hypothetical protein